MRRSSRTPRSRFLLPILRACYDARAVGMPFNYRSIMLAALRTLNLPLAIYVSIALVVSIVAAFKGSPALGGILGAISILFVELLAIIAVPRYQKACVSRFLITKNSDECLAAIRLLLRPRKDRVIDDSIREALGEHQALCLALDPQDKDTLVRLQSSVKLPATESKDTFRDADRTYATVPIRYTSFQQDMDIAYGIDQLMAVTTKYTAVWAAAPGPLSMPPG